MASTSTLTDTIFALSSAPGRAGVAVIRLSGAQSPTAVKTLCGSLPAPRRAVLRRLTDPANGALIDRGLVLYFPSPGTFTGEDIAEFQIHGGRAVIAALVSVLGNLPGCRLAEPGEFALRAFENGKLDLAQAEGLADLIDAETEAQRRQALNQAEGALSRRTESWRTSLIEAMSLVEAAIDFSDETDVSDNAVAQAERRITALSQEIATHLSDGHRGEILRDGFKVVLAGAPNVGKSSLLNALARREVAIVSAEAGTTRDVIEVRLDLEGVPVIITDTAGLREAEGEIEQEGIRRTIARAHEANLVLWVIDASAQTVPGALPEELEGKPTLIVANKCDISSASAKTDAAIQLSAKSGTGLETLIKAIAAEAAKSTEGAQSEGVITHARHRKHLTDCQHYMQRFLDSSTDIELRAEDLRLAADSLGRITGRIDPEAVLDQVFGRFCIGK